MSTDATADSVHDNAQESKFRGSHLSNMEENEGSSPDKKEFEGTLFHQVLSKLGLESKYPSKISIQDVIVVDPNEAISQNKKSVSLVELPWVMLKRLICAHSESRDITSSDENKKAATRELDHKMSFLFEKPTEKEEISPLDIFNVVYQCCDPLLKQLFFRKLYLCKLAVPFICKHWETKESSHPIVYLWPLRSLTVENRVQSHRNCYKSREVDLFDLETKVVAFARFGRPRYSKSKLLNNLLSNQGCKTFFNIDCPSGTTSRNLIDGNVEMFWLPKVGDKNETFEDAMTFLNMRGNIHDKFDLAVLSFIAEFVDAITIIIDRESILENRKEVTAVLTRFSSVILVIADPLRPADEKAIHNFQSEVLALNSNAKLRLLSTHSGNSERNVIDMVEYISTHIKSHLDNKNTRSIQQRLECLRIHKIRTDEIDENCQQGKKEAVELFQQMKKDGASSHWKQQLTPVHSTYSQQLGELIKIREREKDFMEGENLNSKIKEVRQRQTQSITKTVRLFMTILMRNDTCPLKLKLFLGWLNFFIEREKRMILPELIKNRSAWEKGKSLKSSISKIPSEILNQESNITLLEQRLNEASFSVEHFFREIGHIYDAVLALNVQSSTDALPPVHKIANIIGKLVSSGYQLELIDGESFYMPYLWTKTVLKQVDAIISPSKVMTLSVLGLQSSGKSTLLNTMFGSHFSTRTGRCTKGIHVQLIPVNPFSFKKIASPYNYVLIVDTEGLRSPELSHAKHEHDNELATVITGIGDVTMLNIMGENTSEIRDILQVIVHAFLRLKMTNRQLDLRKSCAFIHQNVTDTSASENMLRGLTQLIQTLDEMTKESARSEGILDISTFNQVIEFDINSHVWYLKNLWQGNPPMARVNIEYCENIVSMKCKVLENAVKMKNKSYKSLADIIEHTHSLWKGVLNEDFVFSFRNSLEIKAYMEMEKVVHDELWHLESFIRDRMLTQNKFAGCDEGHDLQLIAANIIKGLNSLLAGEKVKTIKKIDIYFKTNKYNDIIEQWKTNQHVRIETLCGELEYIIREHVKKSLALRLVEILTVSSHKTHEEELNRKSMEVAKSLADSKLTEKEIDEHFAKVWESFISKLDTSSYTSEQKRKKMRQIFEKSLKNEFKDHLSLLGESLRSTSNLSPIPNLKQLGGSFMLDDKIMDAISSTKWQNFKKLFKGSNVKKEVTKKVNQIFKHIDDRLSNICQVSGEIDEMTVKDLMHELMQSLRGLLTGRSGIAFQPPFYINICVYVSRFAHPIFEEHNENYFKTEGIAVRLEQYKVQQKISFVAHLNNRKSEDIAAKLFSNVIETFAEEWTFHNLTNKVANKLYFVLPSLKNIAIIEICTDLLEKGDFKCFIRYLQAPKEYSSKWLTDKANMYLFDKGNYTSLAETLIHEVFSNVEACIRSLKITFLSGKSTYFMEKWINDFQENLTKNDYSIPPESFRNVKKEIEQIKNIEYLTDVILAHLRESEKSVKGKFSQNTSKNVKWADTNPFDRIIKRIWGCSEQCAFCGEPCAKNEDHDGSLHYSIQHRPSCCIGTRNKETKDASLESCNFNTQSNNAHDCTAFGYSCNKIARELCSKERHLYRDFKTFLPDWDIAPTSIMHDTSKFWMWFVAKYKNELHNRYNYRVEKIPSSWYEITKEEAKRSLEKTYMVNEP